MRILKNACLFSVATRLAVIVAAAFLCLPCGAQETRTSLFRRIKHRLEHPTVNYDTTYMADRKARWGGGLITEAFGSLVYYDNDSSKQLTCGPLFNEKVRLDLKWFKFAVGVIKFGDKSSNEFDIGYNGRVWGINFQVKISEQGNLPDLKGCDIETGSISLTSYYVLKNKRFCMPATEAGGMKQLRSAHSPLFGLAFYGKYIEVKDTAAQRILNIKKCAVGNGGISAGYAVNIVPEEHPQVLAHFSAMPTLLLLNKNNMTPFADDEAKADTDSKKQSETSYLNFFTALVPAKLAVTYTAERFYLGLAFDLTISNATFSGNHNMGTVEWAGRLSMGLWL